MKILYKDKDGNKLVEMSSGAVGVKNASGKFISRGEMRKWIKEERLGNKVRLKNRGDVWLHDDLFK